MTRDTRRSMTQALSELALRFSVLLSEFGLLRALLVAAGLWLLVVLAVMVYWAPETTEQRRSDELSLLGQEAEATASAALGAFASCSKLGFKTLQDCAASTGPLPTEQRLARAAADSLERLGAYYDRCTKEFTNEYCHNLIHRAQVAIQASTPPSR